jgi:subtilisin family serine protease
MRIPRLAALAALAALALALAPATARADEAPVAEQIIVRHKAGLDAAERLDVRRDSDTELERRMQLDDTELVAVTDGTRDDALAELRSDPDVLWAAPNGIARAMGLDPYWSYLYGLHNNGSAPRTLDADIDGPQAWSVARGTGVTVGVVDSGVHANHPDLAGRLDLVNAKDFVDGGAPDDTNGHGTHVAGIVAANHDNGVGVAGIAPKATVLPVRALDANGDGEWADVLDAFTWAAGKGAKVVNASLGGTYHSGLASAFQSIYATYPDTLFVVAAGNDGTNNDLTPTLPCVTGASNVLCIGASDANDKPAAFSNYGATTVDLFAPGVGIVSTWAPGVDEYCTGLYCSSNGTSMASPYAAGTAALVHGATNLRGAALADRLESTVDPVAAFTGKSVTGGRLNAARAAGTAVDAPDRTVTVTATGGAGAATVAIGSSPGDATAIRVFDSSFRLLGAAMSSSVTVTGLAPGMNSFTVLASFADGRVSPVASASAWVGPAPAPPVPAPAPTTPTPTAPAPAPPATAPTVTPAPLITGMQLMKRGSRQSLVFRITRTSRVTVTLSKLTRGRYRKASSRSVRMAAGLQSLPLTSRLLGMRVPRGRWKVAVGTGETTATVAFTRR